MSSKVGRAMRKGVLALHLWFGLSIGLYFSLMGLTGSILVFERELHPLVTPELRRVAPPTPNAPLLTLSEVFAGLKRQLPGDQAKHLGRIEIPEQAGGAYGLLAGDPEKPFDIREVTLNPYTGQVVRSRRAVSAPLSFLVMLHTTLLSGKAGARLHTLLGVCAALLILSGLWLWWPATMRQLRLRLTVQRDARGCRLARELHNVCGVFALPLLLLAALTGATLGNSAPVQTWLYALTGTKDAPKKITVRPPSNGERLPIETLLQRAEAAAPRDVPVKSLTLPTKPEQPFVVIKSRGEAGFLQRVTLTLDPYTGQTLRVEDERAAPPARRILRVWTRLHFGWWGDWFTKILYSLAGLLPSALLLTGLIQYAHRRRARSAQQARKQQSISPPERVISEHEQDRPASP